MPSSLIFAGLVVLWLLILVPAVARRQQEVVRPSEAALAGRVLARPVRHRSLEDDGMDTDDERDAPVGGTLGTEQRVPAARAAAEDAGHAEVDDTDEEGYAAAGYYAYDDEDDPEHGEADERHWERPPAGFRPGRGGFDAEAAALAARARYAFRQRVVIGLLVLAVVTALVAVLSLPAVWWLHGLVDLSLVGYLVYLRRQVRMEESIRARRASRMAGTRRGAAADDPELDDWAHRGREAAELARAGDTEEIPAPRTTAEAEDDDWTADDVTPERVRGTGEPVGVLPARRRTVAGDPGAEVESALPRIQPAPPPPLPAGTQLVDVDEDEDDLPADPAGTPDAYRRAAGE